MIDKDNREVFLKYLNKLIDGDGYSDDWKCFIIEHYPDEQLEEIRRNIVRLRIKACDPEIFPVTEEQREQLRKWAKELQ